MKVDTAEKAYATLDEFDKCLAFKPDMISDRCVFCGRPVTNRHHIIYRSQGGNVVSPIFSVCGQGNISGCHSLLHTGRLFVRWDDQTGAYAYLRSPQPISKSVAHQSKDWIPLRGGVMSAEPKVCCTCDWWDAGTDDIHGICVYTPRPVCTRLNQYCQRWVRRIEAKESDQ